MGQNGLVLCLLLVFVHQAHNQPAPSSPEGNKRVKLVNNGYEGLVIAISDAMQRDDKVLETLKVR